MHTLSFLAILTITKSSPDAKSEARIQAAKTQNICLFLEIFIQKSTSQLSGNGGHYAH